MAKELDESHPGAAFSLREGLAETLSLKEIVQGEVIEKYVCSTNIIENLNGSIRHVTKRVKK